MSFLRGSLRNHIHLVARNRGEKNDIPAMMQLVASRTAQEYNTRKGRKGAFWEDRYHATAIEAGSHLWRCLTYVDLNMVRAGAVKHPEEWPHGGYHEIQGNRRRNTIVNRDALAEVLELGNGEALRVAHREWISEALGSVTQRREDAWSQSLAVGSAEFVRQTQAALGHQGRYRVREESEGMSVLREAQEGYEPIFGVEKGAIGPENSPFLDDCN